MPKLVTQRRKPSRPVAPPPPPPPPAPPAITSMRLDPAKLKALKILAAEQSRKVNDLVVEAVDDFLAKARR